MYGEAEEIIVGKCVIYLRIRNCLSFCVNVAKSFYHVDHVRVNGRYVMFLYEQDPTDIRRLS